MDEDFFHSGDQKPTAIFFVNNAFFLVTSTSYYWTGVNIEK